MRTMLGSALALVWIVAACSSSSNEDPSPGTVDGRDGGGGNSGDSGGGSSGSSSDGALKIVSLTSDVQAITGLHDPRPTVSHAVTFVAIVTARDGLDTIAGGQIVDEVGKTYAAFGTGAQKGTYTASVEWAQINRISPITFRAPKAGRKFIAQFFDNGGRKAEAPLDVSFFCGNDRHPDAWNACSGTCQHPIENRTSCGCDAVDCTKAHPANTVGNDYCWNGACKFVMTYQAGVSSAPDRCFEGSTALPELLDCTDVCPKRTDPPAGEEYPSLTDCRTVKNASRMPSGSTFKTGKAYRCYC
ncbi:hypothetical protein [Pendulispora albinea]|uniref:Lipoprotein n=1 Tax=Pendulispora albinea TaxID=2741071 RepID=A0ABZ2M362_9BACT